VDSKHLQLDAAETILSFSIGSDDTVFNSPKEKKETQSSWSRLIPFPSPPPSPPRQMA
jgi:hypothetical protein